MKISWVFAAGYSLDPSIDLEQLKAIGSSWGSWKTWRSCNTDNVICHELRKSRDLIHREFQKSCNFHVPVKHFPDIGRPAGVRLYDGDFLDQINDIEDIIALHFAAADSEIILLAGFDFSPIEYPSDPIELAKVKNRHGLMRTVIGAHPEIQWVAVDHAPGFDSTYQNFENLTCDTIPNVLKLLV